LEGREAAKKLCPRTKSEPKNTLEKLSNRKNVKEGPEGNERGWKTDVPVGTTDRLGEVWLDVNWTRWNKERHQQTGGKRNEEKNGDRQEPSRNPKERVKLCP